MSNNEEEVLRYLSSNFSENQLKELLNIYHEFIGEKKSLTTLSQDEIDKFYTQI